MRSERRFYVYIWFRPNGTPCYVGKGTGGRWKDHVKRSGNPHLARIFAKAKNDMPVVIIRDGMTERDAFDLEIALISAIGRVRRGGHLVNLTDGGEGPSGLVHTEDTKRQMSALKKQQHLDVALRAKISVATRAGMAVPEVKERHSAAQKKRFESAEERNRSGAHGRGKKHTAEHRAKISAAGIGRKYSAESRAKMSAWQIGRKMSDEARAKMSAAAKARWATPEARAILSARARERLADPKQREQMSEFGKRGAAVAGAGLKISVRGT